ncbi:MAG: GntR family transcriptional regulator [Acidimicrobiales bacterium]
MAGRQYSTGEELGFDMASWAAAPRQAGGPLHAQIALALASAIEEGLLQPGDRLPTERELASFFGVNRLTLRQSLAELERRRLVRRSVGRRGGTFVADQAVERDLSSFAGFSEHARRFGLTAGAVVLHARKEPACATTAAALEIEPGEEVHEIRRLRLANERPVLIECSSFPAARFAGLLDRDLRGSLYELLERAYDVRPCRAVETIEPVSATKETAQLLEVAAGAPLLGVERTAFDSDGTPIEFARDLFRGDRTRMVVWSFELPALSSQASWSGGTDSRGTATGPTSEGTSTVESLRDSKKP